MEPVSIERKKNALSFDGDYNYKDTFNFRNCQYTFYILYKFTISPIQL